MIYSGSISFNFQLWITAFKKEKTLSIKSLGNFIDRVFPFLNAVIHNWKLNEIDPEYIINIDKMVL